MKCSGCGSRKTDVQLGRELINRGQVRSSLDSGRVRQAGAMSGMGQYRTSQDRRPDHAWR